MAACARAVHVCAATRAASAGDPDDRSRGTFDALSYPAAMLQRAAKPECTSRVRHDTRGLWRPVTRYPRCQPVFSAAQPPANPLIRKKNPALVTRTHARAHTHTNTQMHALSLVSLSFSVSRALIITEAFSRGRCQCCSLLSVLSPFSTL